jgi:death-on-curing protein
LAEPLNVADDPDISRLAASYVFGIARNHAFIYGTRSAMMVSLVILDLNGWDIVVPKGEAYLTNLHLADGSLTEKELAAWFTAHAVPL